MWWGGGRGCSTPLLLQFVDAHRRYYFPVVQQLYLSTAQLRSDWPDRLDPHLSRVYQLHLESGMASSDLLNFKTVSVRLIYF